MSKNPPPHSPEPSPLPWTESEYNGANEIWTLDKVDLYQDTEIKVQRCIGVIHRKSDANLMVNAVNRSPLFEEMLEVLKVVQSRVHWKDYGPVIDDLIRRCEEKSK